MKTITRAFVFAAALALNASTAGAQDAKMSFFITSQGPGDGANLGGLKGADAHCQKLAAAAGLGAKTWRAYLSTSSTNARDRIGTGPWYNAKGRMIAKNIADLHNPATNKINKQTGLTETGKPVNGRGDRPNKHDILTGTKADGTVVADMTCNNWTSNSAGRAFVGHHDRQGLRDDAPSRSWSSSHPTRGCSKDALPRSGGAGFFYCFVAN